MKNLIFLLFLFPYVLFAQTGRPDLVWCLPDSTGLDFRNDTVKIINSTVTGKEACYQFFKFGKLVWCDEGIIRIGSTQFDLWTLNPNWYFFNSASDTQPGFFINDEKNDSCVFIYLIGPTCYSLIQLQINVITEKVKNYQNFFFNWADSSRVFEKNLSVRHTNGRDWWIIYPVMDNLWNICLFENNNLQYYHHAEVGIENGVKFDIISGQAKFSRDGTQMAYAQDTGALYLTDFSRYSGELIYRKHWDFPSYFQYGLYGVEFSANGKHLFYSGHAQNISSDALGLINLTDYSRKTLVDTIQLRGIRQMMLGPDNKLYFRHSYNTCSVVENPDDPLHLIQVNLHKYILQKNNLYNIGDFGLPYFPNYYLGPDIRIGFELGGKTCVGENLVFEDTSRGHFWREWDFGDGSPIEKYHVTQHANIIPSRIDTHKVVTHSYLQPGTYNVSLKIINDSTQYGYLDTIITRTIEILPAQTCITEPNIWLENSTLHYEIPFGNPARLQVLNDIGQLVFESYPNESIGSVQLPESICKGLYMIQLWRKDFEKCIKWVK